MPQPERPDPRWGEPEPTHDPWVLAHFVARPTDVLITTAPKAGTTWMQQLLHQLRTGGDPDFDSIDRVVPWLELPRPGRHWREVLADYEQLPDPRLFKTHCTAAQTPGIGTAHIVLSVRDPRECCVSFYHHILNLTDAARARVGLERPASFAAHVDRWLAAGAWFRNVISWWPYRDHDKVLMLRYQDMQRDLPGCVDRLVDFLGWSLSADQKAAALEYSSFAWMKAHDDKFSRQRASEAPLFKPGGFIREGKTGRFQDLLTPELEQRILERARAELAQDCLRYLELS